jgi:hypothetical protein
MRKPPSAAFAHQPAAAGEAAFNAPSAPMTGPPARAGHRRRSRHCPRGDRARAKLSAGLVCYAMGLPVHQVLSQERGAAAAAFARQVAMYLAHTAFEMSLGRVATAFERDRSTVGHACHQIEDRRDDAGFDAWIASLEAVLLVAPPPQNGAHLSGDADAGDLRDGL